MATIDIGVRGLFVQPFITKWFGLDIWLKALRPALWWLSVAGLVALPLSAAGRLLLVILIGLLLPYAFTWNLGGGGEWRFTMHAYPFYIVAAVYALAGACRAAAALVRDPSRASRSAFIPIARRAATVLAIAAVSAAVYMSLPWFVTREAIAKGDSVSVETGAVTGCSTGAAGRGRTTTASPSGSHSANARPCTFRFQPGAITTSCCASIRSRRACRIASPCCSTGRWRA